ncbi:ABC transporter ATP-binding protein [Peptoniphilus sp. EMRHCC_23]|uniref:ABC transporter ATP-binding protein n=1 Tax=Peptoniphilus rachelemmaiella TaxID=2811779 RepID=UPI001C00181E|nr:ABC transporter ATP-binding protein [Peptoniphilus rachelemmaiella]
MITIDHLHKSYGTKNQRLHVLKDVSFTLPEGSLACLLGPSGSGKSTLLNILGGIETVDEGEIIVNGARLSHMNKKELERYRRKQLGFVFQFYNLVENLTVRENILTGAYLSDDPLNVDALAEELGIADQLHKFPSEISGGQAQRVSIARAMAKKPSLFICDEPTGALDYESAKAVLHLIEDLNKKHKTTILIATHNEALASMCHVILRLHDGSLKSYEENKHILSAEEVQW